MLEPWRTGIVTKIEQAAASTRRFFIQVPELDVFHFKPGQFVTLDLPIHEQRNKRWRSYSIASSPDGTNTFELVIVLLEGGAGTNYLFNQVTTGSALSFRGPQGVFCLPQQLDKDLYFICTGTGVAPFRAMLQHIARHKIPHQNIYLIFGCRLTCDALYRDELKQLEQEIDGYYYLPTFSREPEENREVRRGYVHAIYEELIKGMQPPGYFFLCGWKDMIDEARERLHTLGYTKHDIHLELYG
ncbi:ferredoxin--NADP reductase [Deminuibacter soli]|uniref:Oxidoreductase n=1 Tax=Deminuibacter soli TaxID=2291815 RepID=A0A3E1NPC8_9BACT|nr:FAD-dependent oxidoreductase [Deminuibacter soli]RFM29757.1 oxidoreductase [Deminuibacter soli]